MPEVYGLAPLFGVVVPHTRGDMEVVTAGLVLEVVVLMHPAETVLVGHGVPGPGWLSTHVPSRHELVVHNSAARDESPSRLAMTLTTLVPSTVCSAVEDGSFVGCTLDIIVAKPAGALGIRWASA